MDFPPDIIAQNLTEFCICFFKNLEYSPDSPPHYYITVPINDDSSLLLCIITSQIENRVRYYHNRGSDAAISSLVKVNKGDLLFLKKESIIDCNAPVLILKKEFHKIVDPDYNCKLITRDISLQVRKKVVEAIKNSPIVKPFIKKLI